MGMPKQKMEEFPAEMTSRPLLKNKKLNSLINGHRHARNTPIRKSKFASAECSSCDEGYVGSYTDTTTTTNILAAAKPVTSAENLAQNGQLNLQQNLNKLLSPSDQLELLKFLLQHTLHVPLEAATAAAAAGDTHESCEFFIPPIYDDSREKLEFDTLLQNPNCHQLPAYYASQFDIFDKLHLSEDKLLMPPPPPPPQHEFNSNLTDEWTWDHLDLSKRERLLLIQSEINGLRAAQDKMDEIDLMSANKWRFILERRRRLEQIKSELSHEDTIDAQAYLNEIEMNIDYYTHDHDLAASQVDFGVDQMLTFKTNKMAFNLRDYHRNLILNKSQSSLLANLKVDSIQEFVPVPAYLMTQEEDVSMNEEVCQINEHAAAAEDENNTLCGVTYENQDQEYYEEEQQQYYFENEEDYEDYEDQMLIDNLTEEEALTLLQSESEMYALQMSQAAKLGISMNEIKDFVSVIAEADLSSPTAIQSSSSQQPDEDPKEANMDSNNNDIFENVFNYYEHEYCVVDDGVSEEMTAHVNEYNLGDEIHTPENPLEPLESEQDLVVTTESSYYYEDAYTTSTTTSDTGIDSCAMTTSTSGEGGGCSTSASPTPYFNNNNNNNTNISLSLRNSLLKLRHSRRHLAVLIETNKSTTTTTTSSSASAMSLYKQHMLNMQQQSRKPCVYMLNEGRCARADCRFVHDLKTIMCKYWLEGECIKGENCEFSHEFIEETVVANTRRAHKSSFSSSHSSKSGGGGSVKKSAEKAKTKKIDFKLETEDFPSLGGFPALPPPLPLPTASADQQQDDQTNPTQSEIKRKKKSLPEKEDSSVTVVDSSPVKTVAAALLFSNITKSKSQVEQRPTIAVNIVSNKQQSSSSSSSSKNSKQTGKQQNVSQHKSRANKSIPSTVTTNGSSSSSSVTQKTIKLNLTCDGSRSVSSLSSSNGSSSRPNSTLRITQTKKK
jgi:hypothetical protein